MDLAKSVKPNLHASLRALLYFLQCLCPHSPSQFGLLSYGAWMYVEIILLIIGTELEDNEMIQCVSTRYTLDI